MLEPALNEQVAFLHRELDRQKKRVTNMTYKLDEVINTVNAVQSMIDGMKRDIKENGFIKEVQVFKAQPIGDGKEND